MALTYITKCVLCGKPFNLDSFSELIKTETGRSHLSKIAEKFNKHLKEGDERHQAAYASAMMPGIQFGQLLILQNYRTDDQSANEAREFMRHSLFQMVKARSIGDEAITNQVRGIKTPAGHALPAEYHAQVIGLIQQMRDILEELGQFAPKPIDPVKAPSALVVAP